MEDAPAVASGTACFGTEPGARLARSRGGTTEAGILAPCGTDGGFGWLSHAGPKSLLPNGFDPAGTALGPSHCAPRAG